MNPAKNKNRFVIFSSSYLTSSSVEFPGISTITLGIFSEVQKINTLKGIAEGRGGEGGQCVEGEGSSGLEEEGGGG